MENYSWGFLLSIGIAVGWIAGVTIAMVTSYGLGAIPSQSFSEAVGNTLLFGSPGIFLFIVAMVFAIRDDFDEKKYGRY